MKRNLLFLSFLFSFNLMFAQTNPHNFSVGTNLTDINSYGPQIIFKDLMKHAQEWVMLNPTTFNFIRNSDGSLTNIPRTLLRSADGYPLSSPFTFSSQQVIAQANILDGGPNPLQAGEYEVSFAGSGQIGISGNGTSLGTGETSLNSSSPSDKIRFNYNDLNGDGMITLSILSSTSSNPVRDIHIVPVQFLPDFTTQPFHPKFLEFLQPFTVIRFMDYMRTNNSPIVNFSDRCPQDYYTYTTDRGGPYELLIDLCNQTQKDPWVCIPHQANNSYITSLANLLFTRLDSTRKVFVEYTNEAWNPGFEALQYMMQQGQATFGNISEELSLGDITPNGRGMQFFAKRNCDVYQLFANVYGNKMASRVCKVMGAQAANANTAAYPLSIMLSNNFPTNNQKPDVVAIAPYLAADFNSVVPPNTTLSESVILDSLAGQVNSFLIPCTRAHKAVTDEFQIDLITYEGGQHLIPSSANVTKFRNVMKNARMRTIYCDMLDKWKQESGGLFMHFTSIYQSDIFGCWGAVESMNEVFLDQPKYKALVECGTPSVTPPNCFVSASITAPGGTDLCTGNKSLTLTTSPSPCSGCSILWVRDTSVVTAMGTSTSATTGEGGSYRARVTFPCPAGGTKTILSNVIDLARNVPLELRLEGTVPQVSATPNTIQNLVANPNLKIPTTGTRERQLIINAGDGIPMFNGVQITDLANTDGTNNFFTNGFIIHARKAGSYTLQTTTATCGVVTTKPIVLIIDSGNGCLNPPPAPASIIATLLSNVCGARTYRYTAPALAASTSTTAAATGWVWSFVGTLGSTAIIDSGSINSKVIKVRFISNDAAATGDSARVAFTSLCGNSLNRALRLPNTLLGPPLAPASITINLVSDSCGKRIYRYTAPILPTATTTAMAATGYIWSFVGTLGSIATLDSGTLNSRVVRMKFASNVAAVAGDSARVLYTSGCGNSPIKALKLTNTLLGPPLIPTITITPVQTNVCGNRVYRYTAPTLPIATATSMAATGYVWSFVGTLGTNATLDTIGATLNSRIIKMKYTSNAAAATGDSVRLFYTSACGNSPVKALKLSNTLLTAPAAPASIIINPVQTDVCGNRIYRYVAPVLPAATTTAVAPTGYVWSFVGTLGTNAVIDSGTLTGRIVRMKYTSNAASATGDSARVLYTSATCGNSPRRALKLSNLVLNPPATPASILISTVTNTCGNRVFRYTAPVLPGATTTSAAPTGYIWSFVGTLGATATLDSGTLTGQIVRMKYTSNAAAATGDSGRVLYTSATCGNSLRKAQKLSNAALACTTRIAVTKERVIMGQALTDAEVYPNPSFGNFTLQIPGVDVQSAIVTLRDVSGKKVSQFMMQGLRQKTFGENLQPGTYFMEIMQGNQRLIRKVVKAG